MDEINTWVFSICCAALLCGIVSLLIPNRSMEKISGLVIGMFMLRCFLTPIPVDWSEFQIDTDLPKQNQSEVVQEINDYFAGAALDKSEQKTKKIILKQLAEYGINEEDIQIYIVTETNPDTANPELVVEVTLPESMRAEHQTLQKALEYELGTQVRLGYAEQEDL